MRWRKGWGDRRLVALTGAMMLAGCGGGGSTGSAGTAGTASTAGGASTSTATSTSTAGTTGGGTSAGVAATAAAIVTAATTTASAAASTAVSTIMPAAPSAPTATNPVGTSAPVQVVDREKLLKETDAARLAKQATFGPTVDLVNHIVAVGPSAWLDEQFAATGSTYADFADAPVLLNVCPTDPTCQRKNFTREPVAMRFYADALSQPDQLRQRVALALSQIVVASITEVGSTAGVAGFNQILLNNAFGNYRDLLMAATMNGFMGDYLDMADSNKSAPSENYAREMLQLFSMGPEQLAMDGTPIKDSTGAAIPNYTIDDIKGVAKALTGWTLARLNGAAITDSNARDWSKPMIAVPARYDSTAKTFFGISVPAGASQADSVAAAVDAAFNHASTAPFISRRLIQHLVTSNPSPAYVGRVAAVFANNGRNVRGDMKAVIRAILMDAEARSPSGESFGKVKEPILLLTSLGRAIGLAGDGLAFTDRDTGLGQPVFRSPSVFNFFPSDYPLAGTNLVSPPSKLLTTGLVIARHNLVYDWTIGALAARSEFAANANVSASTGMTADWSSWQAVGGNLDALVDRVDLVIAGRALTATQKAALKSAAGAVTNADPALLARARAQTMLYLVGTSPLFQVDR